MSRVKRLPAPTGVTIVELSADGDRRFLEERHGASRAYRPDHDDIAYLRTCAWVHCVNLDEPEPLVSQLEGVPLSFDFGLSGFGQMATALAPQLRIAFFSAPDHDRDAALELGRQAVAAGAGLAVVTRGRRGSMALDHSLFEVPAEPVQVVDTLGAGDALIAAVIAARLHGMEPSQALAAGSVAAARACGHYGAWESVSA
jgi:fructoselysine 6-kinase